MSARNFRIPIHTGGVAGNGFLPPTIYDTESLLSDDIQKTEGAANLNMDVDEAMGLQHGPMSVLGAEDAVEDTADSAAGAATVAVGDAADTTDAGNDVGSSSSSSPLSSSPTVDHVETTADNADGGDADVDGRGRGGGGGRRRARRGSRSFGLIVLD